MPSSHDSERSAHQGERVSRDAVPQASARDFTRDAAHGKQQDERWMREALELAAATVGLAAPNPYVGCVLVRDGVVIGRGAHRYDQKLHAEAVALAEAKTGAAAANAIAGSTAYVTLEPCAHQGRTPPCANALVAAGIKRVVVATGDPNPLVNGKGIEILRSAGIAVTQGVLRDQARALNDGFARVMRTGLPFVTLKAALSLDGRIAPPVSIRQLGHVNYLTGARSLLAVHTMRHATDAVLTGIGTALADNPLLTDRSGGQRRRPLLRVVLDSQLRLPLESQLARTAIAEPERTPLLLCTPEHTAKDPVVAERRSRLENAGIAIATVARTEAGIIDIESVLRLLAERYQVLHVLTEAGAALNRALLAGQSPIADKLTLFYAPLFLGGDGVPLVSGGLPLAVEMHRSSVTESGSDFRLDAYLRDPWKAARAATDTDAETSSKLK
jgi:diaminohydroxyphosphoribosylaminopyrimidine deaminase/5-amino-6-(5-phosphoribosylamino)uracil reductase